MHAQHDPAARIVRIQATQEKLKRKGKTGFSGGFSSLLKGWLHKAGGPRATKAEEFLKIYIP